MEKFAIVRFLDEIETPYWSDFVPRYLAHAKAIGKRFSTMRCSEIPALNDFSHFAAGSRLADLVTEKIDAWKNLLSIKYKQNTVRRKLLVVAGVFTYAVSIRVLSANPCDGITIPWSEFAGRALTDTEISLFLPMLSIAVRRACEFSLYTGMRRCEVIACDWSWVRDNCLTIPAIIAKSKTARTVMLQREALDILGPVRSGGNIFGLTDWKINGEVTAAWKKLGLGRIRFHDMRHTAITRFLEKNPDYGAAMSIFGWKSTRSMMPYEHITALRHQRFMGIEYKNSAGMSSGESMEGLGIA